MPDTGKNLKAKKRLLIVEDDEDIRELIVFNLKMNEEYEVFEADNGEDAIKIAETIIPHLVLLDIMLPGIDGFEVCKRLNENPSVGRIPIIMLTARSEDSDVVRGLELGVEDYLKKPFGSIKILLAKISNVLQRNEAGMAKKIIEIDNIVIDPSGYKVTVKGKDVELSVSEFKLLQLLAENPGTTFSRDMIFTSIKQGRPSSENVFSEEKNNMATSRTVDVQILSLRKKLGSSGNFIQTVRGAGYRFKSG